MELSLDDVRQLSDRYEAYYHETMVYPAVNTLGRGRVTRALVLGGGDGGIATYLLKYSTMKRVVVAELDEQVVNTSMAWFPAVARSYSDPRCTLKLGDALAWVDGGADGEVFDVIIIDFTDEPVEGTWSIKFFKKLKSLLSPHGALVQNMGTIATGDIRSVFRKHQKVFKKVYPISTLIPDYLSPYFLVLSSDTADPSSFDREFWREQRIVPKYYSEELHEGLFVMPANFARFLHMDIPSEPVPLAPLKRLAEGEAWDEDEESDLTSVVTERRTKYNMIQVRKTKKCPKAEESCHGIRLNFDYPIGPHAYYVLETVAYPAMNILGHRAKQLLILGGGTLGLASYLLKFPSVERLVIVEIDEELIDTVVNAQPFRRLRATRDDPRVEVTIADVYEWLAVGDGPANGVFDAVFVDLGNEHWMSPSRTTRAPQSLAFYQRLHELLTPHGLLVQDAGTIATTARVAQVVGLHKRVMETTWVLSYARLPDNLESIREISDFPNDAIIRRPPRLLALSSRDASADPLAVDWSLWAGLGLVTEYYHAALHAVLFVLPAELQRHFRVLPPAAMSGRGTRVEL